MQIDLNATVVDSSGETVGRLHEIIFALDSRRVAGFLVVIDGLAPREVRIMAGQAAEIAEDRITLTISGEELAALPDAYQRLYVAPNQDLEEEIEAAEETSAAPTNPDPDEYPGLSAIPGLALTPNLLIPIEVERSVVGDDQIALGADLRVLTADGEELGHLGAVIVNDEAQLESLVLAGWEGRTIAYALIGTVDEETNELTLLSAQPDAAWEAAEEAESVAVAVVEDEREA